jgi:hypothetical protein
MLATIRGEPTDMIPWAPRMDLWAIAQRARGTMPTEFIGRDLVGIADVLGSACRVLQGDFYTRPLQPVDLALYGFGITNHPDFPYRVDTVDLPTEFKSEGWRHRTVIETGAGRVVTEFELTPQMQADGAYDPVLSRRPIQSPDDLEAVARVFEHLVVAPQPRAYETFVERIGDSGLAVAAGPASASPMHVILHDLMDFAAFVYLYDDDRAALRQLASRIEPFLRARLDAVLETTADVFIWGANYDRSVTWPPFFRDEIAPWLADVSRRAHARGKLVLTHADGENDGLVGYYPECGFDIAESVCTKPMVRLSLAELRAGFGERTTVWGGIPAVALLEEAMDEEVFEGFLDSLFDGLGTGERLILGVSDNVPPDAKLSRLATVMDRIMAFGPVRPRGKREE